jgi:CBS domain-containing protein
MLLAKNIMKDGILPLKTSDTGREALESMEDYRVMHLPIVNNEALLGLISEFDVLNFNDLDEAVGNHTLSISKAYVYDYQYIYDVMRLMYELKLTLIPIVDSHENYLGSVTLQSLLEQFASSLSVAEPGGVIVLEMSSHDYSLSEIARIVEANDAKILSVLMHSEPDSMRVEVSLKINRLDISAILQTFTRYNYNILLSFSESDNQDDLRKRYDLLMNYLNI